MTFIKNSQGSFGKTTFMKKGTSFFRDGKKWIVVEEFYSDNTEIRRVRSDTGDEEIVTADTLRKDARTSDFVVEEEKPVEIKPVKKVRKRNSSKKE